jgi:SAM-dependent methyltransferase
MFDSKKKTEFGIRAIDIDQEVLVKYKIPERIRDEIPTLNQFGYMKEELDEFTEEFLNYSEQMGSIALELGTAYGWVVQRALERGIKIIANDISQEHLTVLLKQTPKEFLENLYLYLGSFHKDIDFPSNSIGALLSARMFHFLEGKDIEIGLDKINRWLKKNGKFFFSSCSIYHYSVIEKMLPIYKKKATEGEAWPGRIPNQKEVAPMHAPYIQDLFHVFDIPELEKLLPKHGFKIEKMKLFDYPSDRYSAGKGHVGFVATKI